MNWKEVAIGDYVKHSIMLKDHKYEKDIQITNIYGSEVNCEVRDYRILSGIYVSELSPIQLTYDFFIKNDFFPSNNELLWNNGTDYINIKYKKNKDSQFICTKIKAVIGKQYINYHGIITAIHELQHILRVCGIELKN